MYSVMTDPESSNRIERKSNGTPCDTSAAQPRFRKTVSIGCRTGVTQSAVRPPLSFCTMLSSVTALTLSDIF